jgi:small subunit ribosomal protein S7e
MWVLRFHSLHLCFSRPRSLLRHSRTLTAVHEKILDDLVFPNEILGKRLRYKADGSRLIKVHLQLDKTVVDRTDAFTQIYKRLTTKDVTFEFPATLA